MHWTVPEGQIRWLLGRVHVGTPDTEVEADAVLYQLRKLFGIKEEL